MAKKQENVPRYGTTMRRGIQYYRGDPLADIHDVQMDFSLVVFVNHAGSDLEQLLGGNTALVEHDEGTPPGLALIHIFPDTSMCSPASIWMSTEALPEDPDDQDLVNTTALVPSFL